jgi:hypothetical protein
MSFEDTPQPKGLSTTAKVLILLLGFSAVCLAICCGGGAYFFTKSVQVTQDPAQVGELTNSIAHIDIPAEFTPKFGMSMSLWMTMQMALYEGPAKNSITLMQMKMPAGVSDEQMEHSFEQQLENGQQDRQLKVTSRETRKVTIDGTERTFQLVTGTTRDSTEPVKELRGIFPGRNGTAFLIIQAPEKDWNDDLARQVISSVSTGSTGKAQEQPAAEPKVDTPAAESPATDKPGTDKPATDKPEIAKPEMEKPSTEKSAPEQPKTEKADAPPPETSQPETSQPESSQPKPTQPAPPADQVGAEKTEAGKTEANKTGKDQADAQPPAAQTSPATPAGTPPVTPAAEKP